MPSAFVEETRGARLRLLAIGLGIIGLLYIVAFVMPMLYMVAVSLEKTRLASKQPKGFTGTWAAYHRFWGSAYYRQIMYFSLKLAFASVVTSLVIGLPLAYTAARGSRFLKAITIIAVVNPLFVSTIVRAFGLHMLLGYLHIKESFLATLIGTTQILLPFMVLPLMAGFRHVEPLTIHSARTLGSGRVRIAARIVLPELAPSLLAGSILVFILAMNIFSIPLILGKPTQPTMALLVYQAAFTTGNFTFAAVVALTLLALSVVVIFVQGRLARGAASGVVL
jgi:putative spermidine/putrescine transport system permease protein